LFGSIAAVSGFLLPRPPVALLEEFERLTVPMFAQARILANQNVRLRAARDLLLPKLISGEIELSAAPAPDDVARDAA
jgi:type I restriction enzyme, S subunit